MRASVRTWRVVLCSVGIVAGQAAAGPGGGNGGGGGGGGSTPPADPAIACIGGSNAMLAVMNEDGSNLTALGLSPAGYPAWSPDLDGDPSNGYQGTLAFELRLADGIEHCVLADVRVVSGAPAAVRVRTLSPGYGYQPAWSPDLDAATPGYQGRIAYVDNATGVGAQTLAWDGNGPDPSTVHDPVPATIIDTVALDVPLIMYPTWSPDGSRMAFTAWDWDLNASVRVVDDLTNPQPRVITSDPGASYHAPDWSHTGSVVAYSRSRTIVLNDVDQVGEAATGASGNGPSFSADDSSIVFAAVLGRNWAIQRFDFSTGVTTTLLSQKKVNFMNPDWRPFD